MNAHSEEVQAILAKYPAGQKRAAVMPLLFLAQRENLYLTKDTMQEIGDMVGISGTEVASIAGFYTLFHEQPEGSDLPQARYRIQVCTDLPCALRGAEQFLEQLCENVGIRVGETTPDGAVTIEAVTCLAGCNKAPLFQVQSGDGLRYYENQTVASARALIDELRKPEEGA